MNIPYVPYLCFGGWEGVGRGLTLPLPPLVHVHALPPYPYSSSSFPSFHACFHHLFCYSQAPSSALKTEMTEVMTKQVGIPEGVQGPGFREMRYPVAHLPFLHVYNIHIGIVYIYV